MRGVGGIVAVDVGGVGGVLQTAEVHAWLMHVMHAREMRFWRSRGGGARLGLAWFWNKHPSREPKKSFHPTSAVFLHVSSPRLFSEALCRVI